MKAINNIILSICLLFCFNSFSFSQMQEDTKEFFDDGEYFLAYGDYREALFNFLNITKKGVNNSNIQYRIGLCYINLEGEKIKAIPYLEEAVKSVTLEYQEGSSKEFQAPKDALFQLAVAYHVNNEFDKALLNYRKYISLLAKEDVLSLKYTQQQMAACKLAPELISTPKNHEFIPLDDKINNPAANFRPIISANDSVFAFMTKLKFYDAINIVNHLGENNFEKVITINQDIKSDGKLLLSSISNNGRSLYFVMNDNFNSDIYFSNYSLDTKQWTQFEKFKPLNTKYWESHASVSADGKQIYFTSNRPGGIGGMDIYVITKKTETEWSKPEALNININTIFNEETPFVTSDGKKLFFSSQGHKTMGGYDIFVSEKNGSSWSNPVNIGSPINTTDDDMFFVPIGNGDSGYYSKMNGTNQDIFLVKLSK